MFADPEPFLPALRLFWRTRVFEPGAKQDQGGISLPTYGRRQLEVLSLSLLHSKLLHNITTKAQDCSPDKVGGGTFLAFLPLSNSIALCLIES